MAQRREVAYEALFDRLCELAKEAGGPFRLVSRCYRTWEDTPASQQPALYMTLGDQEPVQSRGLPAMWRCWANVWVYCQSNDPAVAPAIQLNDLIDAVEGALMHRADEPAAEAGPFSPAGAFATTLGGAVDHAWIGVPVMTDEGFEGQQGVARIQIQMLTATQ